MDERGFEERGNSTLEPLGVGREPAQEIESSGTMVPALMPEEYIEAGHDSDRRYPRDDWAPENEDVVDPRTDLSSSSLSTQEPGILAEEALAELLVYEVLLPDPREEGGEEEEVVAELLVYEVLLPDPREKGGCEALLPDPREDGVWAV